MSESISKKDAAIKACQAADKAAAAYDGYVCGSVGKVFDAALADSLASVAAVAYEAAAKAGSEAGFSPSFDLASAQEFNAICGGA